MNKNVWKSVDIYMLVDYLVFTVEGKKKIFNEYEYVKSVVDMNISRRLRKRENVLYYNILNHPVHCSFLYCVDGGYMRYYCTYYSDGDVYVHVQMIYKNGKSRQIHTIHCSFKELVRNAKFFSSIDDHSFIL